ncbi:MAG: protein phosphatase 2C domain-containing protein [Verrucomicrobiae bacterium]|nr:protein phosphatase 2C domain-containing protein [Verrucomicrobiae bacterium]
MENSTKDKMKQLFCKFNKLAPCDNNCFKSSQKYIENNILLPCVRGELAKEDALSRWKALLCKAEEEKDKEKTTDGLKKGNTSTTANQTMVEKTDLLQNHSTKQDDLSPQGTAVVKTDIKKKMSSATEARLQKEAPKTVRIDGGDSNPEILHQETSERGGAKHNEDGTQIDIAMPDEAQHTVPLTKPKPEWKNLEPEDNSDPVDHEQCDYREINEDWYISAASVRGKLHAHMGTWRDDSYAFDNIGEWTLMAVADGAGSAPLSRVGSRIACDTSVAHLKMLLEDFSLPVTGDKTPRISTLEKVKAFLVSSATEGRNALIREAHQRKKSLKEFNTTLLLVLHCEWNGTDVISAIQIGDGAVGLYDNDDHCTLLGVADHGEHSSETIFLTSTSELAKKSLDQRVVFSVKEKLQAIAIMSDGVADDFFPETEYLIQLFNGDPTERLRTKTDEPLCGIMKEVVPNPMDGTALLNWLRYEKKQSSDDRTLLVMARKQK